METNTLNTAVKIGLAGFGGFVGYVWGEWTVLLQVLTALVIIDYVTGLLAGIVEGKLSSKRGYKGIIKKLGIFIFVAVAHFIDMALGTKDVTRDAVIMFYIGNELISLIENGGRMGLPIPQSLRDAVEIFKGDDKKEGKK